jgi:hypothetical protein
VRDLNIVTTTLLTCGVILGVSILIALVSGE